MGFGKDEVAAHGLRATASPLLNESGLWNPDAIERALAHSFSGAVRGAYHRGQHWDERIKMAAWWSEHLDSRHDSGQVLAFKRPLTRIASGYLWIIFSGKLASLHLA